MIEYRVKVFDNKTEWYLNGNLHREDGPAIEYANDDKCWFLNGKRHREDGPAIEWNNGDKFWYFNGKRHREDGPAIEYSNGKKYWFLNGIELTKEEFMNRNSHKLVIDRKELIISNEYFNELNEESWRVVCAAMFMDDDMIITGVRHYSPDMRAVLYRIYGDDYHKHVKEQGFIDSQGNFLSRKDAWIRADQNGQIFLYDPSGEGSLIPQPKNKKTKEVLFSENLY